MMDWPFLLSLLLALLVFVGVQLILVRRRLRARVMQQLELLAHAEIEKQLRQRWLAQAGRAEPSGRDTGPATEHT